jgi:two-component system nitrogen regulation sensor histidine kinase NtrY
VRLRTKLTAVFALLAIVPLAIVVPWAVHRLTETLSEELEARLDSAVNVAQTLLTAQRDNTRHALDELASSIAVEDVVRSLHEGTSPAQLRSRTQELMQSRQLSALSILDAKGKTLASGHLPARVGDVDEVLFSVTHDAQASSRSIPIELRGEEGPKRAPALLAAAAPTYAYGDVRIWVVGGVLLDAHFCEQLSQATGAHVELWFEEKILAQAGSSQLPLTRILELGPWTELRVSFSQSALLGARRALIHAFLTATALGLVLAWALGVWMARRTTRPIEALTEATRQVGRGELDRQVTETSSGELQELIDHFNGMTRALETTTSQLVQAERVAAWQEVARRLAHELKNPLTPIQMSLETLLAAQKERSPAFEAIFSQSAGAVLEEVERLRRIVDEFSRFARLPKPNKVRVDLSDLCRQVLSLYPPDKAIRLESSLPAGIEVDADRDQLTPVLLNLLQNAHEAIVGAGVVSLNVSEHEGLARVEVEDTGPGVPREARARVFEPYFTTKGTGTGLGLAIAARIAQEHGGVLAVEDGRAGARFVLTLPHRSARA